MQTWSRLRATAWPVRLGMLGVIVLGILGIWFFLWRAPEPDPEPMTAAVAPPSIPLLVSAGTLGPARIAMGGSVALVATAVGTEEVAALELWVGEERVREHLVVTPGQSVRTTWSWVPEAEGTAVAFVRAIDALGRVAQSNAVRITVDPPLELNVAAAAATVPRAAFAQDAAPPVLALPIPTLALTLSECQVSVEVAGTPEGTGYGIYDLAPSTLAFVPIGVKEASSQAPMSFVLQAGLHLLAASAFDEAAEVFADPVLVDVPDECGGGWAGDVALQDGMLLLPQAVDRAYFYLRRDDEAALRIPAEPGTFIEPLGGLYDASAYLPALEAQTLHLEAWGWQGSELVFLGTGTWTDADEGGGAAPGTSVDLGGLGGGVASSLYHVGRVAAGNDEPDFCLGDICYLEKLSFWVEVQRPPPLTFTPSEQTFRWATPFQDVTSAVWQVFLFDPPDAPDLDPPYVLDQGLVPLDDPAGGEFVLDVMPYITGLSTPNVTADEPTTVKLKPLLDLIASGGAASSPPAQPSQAGPINVDAIAPGVGSNGNTFDLPEFTTVPSDVWVRVIPIQDSTPLPPTNAVQVHVVDQEVVQIDPNGPDHSDRFQLAMTFTPPIAPDPARARCAVVEEVTSEYDPNAFGPQTLIWNLVIQKGGWCYSPPDDDGWSPFDVLEAFVEFVGDAWDWVGTAWDDIKGAVVDFVLVAVPCEEFASESTCEKIAATALDAALVSVGIPPSLPDFDSAVAALKGDIADAMIELAGLEDVCEDAQLAKDTVDSSLPTCQDVVDAALDEMIAHVEQQQSNAAGGATGLGSPPPGIILKPDPAGLWTPPTVTVTATRVGADALPPDCHVVVSMSSELADHTWFELVNDDGDFSWVEVSGDVTGFPLSSESYTLPDLPVGQAFTQKEWLIDANDWWESTAARQYEVWYDGGNPYFWYENTRTHTWELLKAGAQLTFTASSNCAEPVQATHVLTTGAAPE